MNDSMCEKNYFYLCILFATSTIIQITFHAGFAVYGYYMNICSISPTNAPVIFFYLTYLYREACGPLKLESVNSISIFTQIFDTVESTNLSVIIREILDKADFPEHAGPQPRMWRYLLGFIIIDSVWLVAAVALLMGALFRIKEYFTLIYYGPWLFITSIVLLVDAAATVHFAFDIFKTNTFTDWMKFVGIKNVQDLQDFDEIYPDILLPLIPTIVMLIFLSKFVVFWIMNIFGLYYVIQATNFQYSQTYRSEYRRKYKQHHNSSGDNTDLDLDTSEARIRNWQLFYGGNDTTQSNTSVDSNYENNSDLNSSTRVKSDDESPNHSEKSVQFPAGPAATYYAYPNVDSVDLGCLDELRGQKPWSYFIGHENSALNVIKQLTEPEPESIELSTVSIRQTQC